MKKFEITKKGKIILIVISSILILTVIVFLIIKANNPKLESLNLNVKPVTENSKWDADKMALILHVNSKAQLTYSVYPEKAKAGEIKFNNFDRDIINIDSLGVITGLKTGITELQIRSDEIKSHRIKIYVY